MPVRDAQRLVFLVLDHLGVDPYNARTESGNCWVLRRGSSDGLIAINEDDEDPNRSTIFVSFEIMKVPLQKALPFYRRLLELNNAFGGRVAFALGDLNQVWLNAGRYVEGLDVSELLSMVEDTSHTADIFDDLLLEEFGETQEVTRNWFEG